ncbi:MAG: hypothetical protein JNN11_02310 [Candidatus Doudnabacteria bacterium]|nr:hypothetical protein [Candidatus Doudnabacteria bacterium]
MSWENKEGARIDDACLEERGRQVKVPTAPDFQNNQPAVPTRKEFIPRRDDD